MNPVEVGSNASIYLHALGFTVQPDWLISPRADNWAVLILVVVAALSGAAFVSTFYRRDRPSVDGDAQIAVRFRRFVRPAVDDGASRKHASEKTNKAAKPDLDLIREAAVAESAKARSAKIAEWRAMALDVQKRAHAVDVERKAGGSMQPRHAYVSQQLGYRPEYLDFVRAYEAERNRSVEYRQWIDQQASLPPGERKSEFDSWGHGRLMGSVKGGPSYDAPVYHLLRNIDRLEKWWGLAGKG